MLCNMILFSYTSQCVCYQLVLRNYFILPTAQCPLLLPILNGTIKYSSNLIAGFNVETVVTHSCDDGFLLVGSEIRVCLDTGRWSGLTPVCQCT